MWQVSLIFKFKKYKNAKIISLAFMRKLDSKGIQMWNALIPLLELLRYGAWVEYSSENVPVLRPIQTERRGNMSGNDERNPNRLQSEALFRSSESEISSDDCRLCSQIFSACSLIFFFLAFFFARCELILNVKYPNLANYEIVQLSIWSRKRKCHCLQEKICPFQPW